MANSNSMKPRPVAAAPDVKAGEVEACLARRSWRLADDAEEGFAASAAGSRAPGRSCRRSRPLFRSPDRADGRRRNVSKRFAGRVPGVDRAAAGHAATGRSDIHRHRVHRHDVAARSTCSQLHQEGTVVQLARLRDSGEGDVMHLLAAGQPDRRVLHCFLPGVSTRRRGRSRAPR